jgi:CRP/FNR family transcriptional regulator
MVDKQDYSWIAQFPQLANIKGPEWASILRQTRSVELPAGVMVYHVGDSCENFLLVLEGSVRVQMFSENGNEIVLYRVEEGQSCILTTSCLLAKERYQAEAVTETPVRAVVFTAAAFEQALAALADFRRFVFGAYAQRVTELLSLIDAIAFGRMDARLATLLLQRIGNQQELQITHQHLANELGTAREVISRLLKEYERRGIVETHRGRLVVKDLLQLRQLSLV